MKKKLTLVLCFCSLLVACSHELPTETSTGGKTTRGKIIVDTLLVTIVYDETPGFLYPMMRHDINFVGHLNVPGFIDGYAYKSDDVGFALIIDYIRNYYPQAGTKFRYKQRLWSPNLRQPGSRVEYEFEASSPQATPFSHKDAMLIERKRAGIRPEPNCQQLTGSSAHHNYPVFSQDGHWIYSRGSDRQNNLNMINRVPAAGGPEEVIVETTEFLGGFALTDNDTKLTFVIWKPHVKSKLIRLDLLSGVQDTVAITAFIWDAALIPIPGARQFITLSDPNSAGSYFVDLLLIDIDRKTVETLIDSRTAGEVRHFGYRPGTREISYGHPVAPYSINVLLLDLDTRETKTFLSHLQAIDFTWAPNGRDFVYSQYLQNHGTNLFLNEAGNTRQITFYPGEDEHPSYSPNARNLAFASRRRNETQIWRLDF
jgi:hypothetical protein